MLPKKDSSVVRLALLAALAAALPPVSASVSDATTTSNLIASDSGASSPRSNRVVSESEPSPAGILRSADGRSTLAHRSAGRTAVPPSPIATAPPQPGAAGTGVPLGAAAFNAPKSPVGALPSASPSITPSLSGAAPSSSKVAPDFATRTAQVPPTAPASPASPSPSPGEAAAPIPTDSSNAVDSEAGRGIPIWLWLLPLLLLAAGIGWLLRRRSDTTSSPPVSPPVTPPSPITERSPAPTVSPVATAPAESATVPAVAAPTTEVPSEVSEASTEVSNGAALPAALDALTALTDEDEALPPSLPEPTSPPVVAPPVELPTAPAAVDVPLPIAAPATDLAASAVPVGAGVAGAVAAAAGLTSQQAPISRLTLTPRSDQHACATWELPTDQNGHNLALRLYDVTDLDLQYQSPSQYAQYEYNGQPQPFCVSVPRGDRSYLADLGYTPDNGEWQLLARSVPVWIPAVATVQPPATSAPAVELEPSIAQTLVVETTADVVPAPIAPLERAVVDSTSAPVDEPVLESLPATAPVDQPTVEVVPALDPSIEAVAAVGAAAAVLGDDAQSQVEAAKFDIGQTDLSRESLADVDSGLADLPGGYGESRIVLLPRDPQWTYAYWDIPIEHREEVRRQGGQRLALRFYDVTNVDLARQSPHSLQEYECEEMARDWYVPIPVSDRDYIAEIGYLTSDGRWLLLARSNPVRIPPVYPSDWYDDEFLTIAWDEDLRGKTFLTLVPPHLQTETGNPIYDEIFSMTESAEALRVAGSLFGSMQHIPGSVAPGSAQMVAAQAVSSYVFPSGVGIWAAGVPTVAGLTMSGAGMSGIGMSGIGMSGIGLFGSMPPIRLRKFWLVAEAELIIYGATEPDATVTIAGRPVTLNPDGTFRFQMPFQDGMLDFPILAVAADGEQTRSVHLTFNRETPLRNTNAKDDATDELF